MRRIALLALLLFAPGIALGAACTESPVGQWNCEKVDGRDQNALATPLPNFVRLLGNNAAAISVPTPAANECIIGDTTTGTAADTFAINCKTGLTVGTSLAAPMPYGSFSSTTNLTAPNTTTAVAAGLNTDDTKSGITHSTVTNNSRIQIDQAGTYQIITQGIADSTSPNTHLESWYQIDGTTIVANSNRVLQIPNATTEMVFANQIILTFTAGQYFEVMFRVDDTGTRFLATGAGTTPTRPASPSIKVGVFKIGS